MTVRVLGPLDTGAEQLSPRERAILAALIVRLGSSVSPAELAEAYWGEDLPATWAQQIKTSIARIRRRLGHDAIATRGSAYAAGIEPDVIDAVRFERLVSTAGQHGLHDEHDRAIDAYTRALGLWRGAAYPELADWEPGVVEAMRLDEIRRSAEAELLDARLKTGDHRAVIPAAERLVREAPLREERWAILALANYQSGRQAEALAVLRAARGRLLDELGIEPGARLTQLETAILRQDPALDPVRPLPRVSQGCPYRGLAAFGPADADEFFGRDTEIDELLERVTAGSITAVTGPSGSGKSSLVLAGVVPRLIERGRRVHVMRPGSAAATELHRIVEDGAADLVVIDQAEELLHGGGTEIEPFCATAARFTAGGGAIMLTIRSDFLDEAAALPHVGTHLARGVYVLAPLSREAMRAAITEPATRAGLRLEPGLVELVLRDAADRSSTLPPLSHAMQETWVRREGITLTVEGYEAAGGIGGAIAQSAEELYQRLGEHDRELCRALMLRLVENAEDGMPIRRRVALEPLLDDPQRRAVVDALVASRLVVADGPVLQIVHEAVATALPRLEEWLQADADGARLMRHVASAADTWEIGGRREDDLLRGARLEAALEWAASADPDLTERERAFLEASDARRRAETEAVREQAARDRRQNCRLRWALAGAAMLLVASVVASGVAVVRGNEATAAAEETLIQAVTSTSGTLLDSNREMAALLAVQAYRRWPDDPRSADALMRVMTGVGPLMGNRFIPDAEWRIGASPIPGTSEVVVVRDGTHVGIHDLQTGELLRTVDTLDSSDWLIRPWVRVSPDGSTIAVVQHVPEPEAGPGEDDLDHWADELVHFYDVASGERIGAPVHVDDFSTTVSFNSDGSQLMWAHMGRIVLVERDSGRVRLSDPLLPVLPPPEDAQMRAEGAFAPGDGIVVSTRDDEALVLDSATFEVRRRIPLPPGTGSGDMVVGADGVGVTYGPEGITAFTVDGSVLWTRPALGSRCSRMAISSVRRLALCGDETGRLMRWNVDTGEQVGDEWRYQLGGGGELALSGDEAELLLMSAVSPSIPRLRLDGGGPAAATLGGPELTVVWGFDPTGRYVVLGDTDTFEGEQVPHYQVWDVHEKRVVLRIPEDVDAEEGALITDPRWVGDRLFVWLPDLETGLLPTAVIDPATGSLERTPLPLNTWWVFPDASGEIVYATLEDIPETEEAESQEVVAYEFPSWRRLPFRIDRVDAEGPVVSLSTTPDGNRIAVTEERGGADPFRTTVHSDDGTVLAAGLPRAQATVLLPDGTLVAAVAAGLELYDSATLTRLSVLPGPGEFVWHLTASKDGQVLAHASSGVGVTLIDGESRRRIGGMIPAGADSFSFLSPDGSGFITSGTTGVQYWTLDPEAHAEAACALVGREPSPEECHAYFAEFGEQHPICD